MRIVSIEEITEHLGALSGEEPRVVVSGNFATPMGLVRALEASRERCRLFAINAQAGWPRRPGLINESPFVGPGMRHDPLLDYLPMRLSLVPRLFDTLRPVDAVLIHTTVPQGDKVSLGIEVNILPAAIERTRSHGGLVIAQLNPNMPYTFGDGELLVDWIDFAVEVDEPLPTVPPRPIDETDLRIGEQVAQFADDGATLQLGIGKIPDAAANALVSRRHLGIWSEMISDGVLTLERAGSLDSGRPIQTSFLFGSSALYGWADANPRLQMIRTEIINDPARIANNPAMVSVNMAMQIDLFAQANASFVDGVVHSGFGGQADFVAGALHSPGGQAVIALHSWHEKTDTTSVLPILTNPVTSFQHSAIVSDQGCAETFGRSEQTQARLIIERVADPRGRGELLEAAGAFGFLRA